MIKVKEYLVELKTKIGEIEYNRMLKNPMVKKVIEFDNVEDFIRWDKSK